MLRGIINSNCSTPPPPLQFFTPLLAKGVYLCQPPPPPYPAINQTICCYKLGC